MIITETMKAFKTQLENHENHENHRIQSKNHEYHENYRIPIEIRGNY